MYESLVKLAAYDQEHNNHPGTDPEEKLFLYTLVRLYKPTKVIEIGVSAGHSTCWIAKAMQDNKLGMLYSVDNWTREHGGAATGPKTAQKRLDDNGLTSWAQLISSDSVEYLKTQKANSAEIVWVDGGHGYQQAMADTMEAIRVANKLVIVHDTNQHAYDDVKRACKDIGNGTFINAIRGMWLRGIDNV